ncbi:Histidine kinase-, DNA gyrase B-, and HSP90-like ATPase [compost metagenome]
MVFQVVDDGVGMTAEQLDTLIANLTPSGDEWRVQPGYGLRNVHERLLLHYGPEAGLTIESRPQAGTRITFSIPLLEEPPCES